MNISTNNFTKMMSALPLAAILSFSASSGHAETFRVTVLSGYSDTVDWTRYLDTAFIPAVEDALSGTEHEIKWNRAYAGTLAKPSESVQFLSEGLADVGLAMTVFSGDLMPMHNLGYYTPFVSSSMSTNVGVMEKLQHELPVVANEWKAQNQTYLGGFAVSEYVIFSSEAIHSVDDLDGLRIGGAGPNLSWLSNTGAVGVPAAANTTYEGLQSGTYDGIIVPLSTASSLSLHEVTSHMTEIGFGTPFLGAVTANSEFFSGLPSEVQAALRAGGAAYSHQYNTQASEVAAKYRDSLSELGVKVSTLDQQAREDWAALIDNPAQAWVNGNQTRAVALSAYMSAMRIAGELPSRDWEQE